MRQCNGKVSPSKAQVKGLAKELKIDESFLPGARTETCAYRTAPTFNPSR
jgi:hypothetical protein